MTTRDRILALIVVVAWGVNFPATALALEHFPPIFMVALRFALVAIPTVIFVTRPAVPWRYLLGVGFGIGLAQFAFLYLAMANGMPSGLASLVLQASAPFTMVIAGFWLREKLSARQIIGISIAVIGLATIAFHRSQTAAVLPVILTLCGALGWAFGNVCTRLAKPPRPLNLTLWMSIVPPVPMLVLSLFIEGPEAIGTSLATAFTLEALPAVLGLAYIVLIATVLGYGIWSTLMSRNPSSTVAPFSMLVPVVGIATSWWMFGETIDMVELCAGLAVIGGVLWGSTQPWKKRGSKEQPLVEDVAQDAADDEAAQDSSESVPHVVPAATALVTAPTPVVVISRT